MKKLTLVLAALSLVAVACGPKGPSPEEVAKRIADSTRVADSVAAVKAAEEAAAARAMFVADSTRKADSVAAAMSKKKKK